MVVEIDNYIVSSTTDPSGKTYFKVCLDGQNTIHEILHGEHTRVNLINEAVKEIERYNQRHGLNWECRKNIAKKGGAEE